MKITFNLQMLTNKIRISSVQRAIQQRKEPGVEEVTCVSVWKGYARVLLM